MADGIRRGPKHAMSDADAGGPCSTRAQQLLPLAAAYALLTLALQLASDTPAFQEVSPVEISSDLLASLGLGYATLQMLRRWGNALTRRAWLLSAAGMLLILSSETAMDSLSAADWRYVTPVWGIAAVLIFQGMKGYMTRPWVATAIWFGIAVQCVAHLTLTARMTLLSASPSAYPALEVLTDTAELLALLAYLVAFELARVSKLDEHLGGAAKRLHSWALGRSPSASRAPASQARVCFSYIAQTHQAYHSLPIAVALAREHRDVDVHVAGTAAQLRAIHALLRKHAPDAQLSFDTLYLPWPLRILQRCGVGMKSVLVAANRYYFASFDALVVPERTSTYLKQQKVPVRLIGTEHGAGDREVTFTSQMRLYDYLLLPGAKQAERLIELGYTRAGKYASGIYAKFDWTAGQARTSLFDNDRPTVLYNPHFDAAQSSWWRLGGQVLEFFARSDEFNLIFAPHIRMFDPVTPKKYAQFDKYLALDHIRIDLGSDQCADMTYTMTADIYLGDVSSQVVEFITQPRPCLFLNAHAVPWRDDLHYRFWHLGTVLDGVDELDAALYAAIALSDEFEQRQRRYLQHTLGEVEPGLSGCKGAQAIVAFLASEASPAPAMPAYPACTN